MTVEFTQEVSSRLQGDHYGWLTTMAKSGQPVPRLVWFYFDGTDIVVYSMPNAAKADAEEFGLADAMGDYSTRLRISTDRVWTTPTEG